MAEGERLAVFGDLPPPPGADAVEPFRRCVDHADPSPELLRKLECGIARAVRIGVRTGITLTASQMATGACLTDTVKSTVQANAMGLLHGSSGLALIKVHYFEPPAVNSTSAATDVSADADGEQSGNIMQVSVENYSLVPLLPRIYNWKTAADTNPLVIQGVYSADLIEPASVTDRPCIGTAP